MKPLYKAGAYLTALVHSVYVPYTLATILRQDPDVAAIANFGVCAVGMSVGFLVNYCPLTFVEKWFRRHYNPDWVFPGGWLQYYSRLAIIQLKKLFSDRTLHSVSNN